MDPFIYEYTSGTLEKDNLRKYYVRDEFYFSHYLAVTRVDKSVDVSVSSKIRRGEARKQKEIDFVVNNFDSGIYIRSAFRAEEDAKMNSELDSLKLTKKFFKKMIIRNDIVSSFYDENGILYTDLID